MRVAEGRDAVLGQSFWWRNLHGELGRVSIDVIVNGGMGYEGIVPLMRNYLDASAEQFGDKGTRQKLLDSLEFVSRRATGDIPTNARWMREYVRGIPGISMTLL